ncbi:PspA/IM30 family protein [Paenibacillus albicereus]|uniref:PspA/IM30 family protein n=1 Tax=Paenibacillus albicereus TaxID=2726185 RepID=A0A6H2GUX3_9BACL|nr:PspA/IM30 family protein [Paenibacillus albicereus]QJC51224.1 PspA/IM30 family protein [Paenibacillus albicereus]
MSIIRRVRDITLATLNEHLEKAEDPVKLIDQFLWATREEIIQSERLHAQYSAHGQHLKMQWLQAEQQREKREQQAVTALKAGEEQLARIALHEKASAEERSAQYRDLYEQSRLNMEDLEKTLQEMRSEYQIVYDKREYYSARMESLKLQQRMNSRYSAAGAGGKPEGMFRRLDDRISGLEHEARSLRDLRQGGPDFAAAERGAVNPKVELELEQLKRKLGQGG